MKNTITIGRHPTLGEVINYYTREDFLAFMLDLLKRHRVVIVIPKTLHWEPDWEHDEVNDVILSATEGPERSDVILSAAEGSKDVDSLRRFIVGKITAAFPDMSRDMRPDYYPSFHQSVWQRVSIAMEGNRARGKDCVFEADLPTWRDAFRDVGAVIALMDQYDVRYRHKFSGHRSLHIVIPAAIIPPGYGGKGAKRASQKLAQHITRWSGAQAHHLPKITRMPYSLNEDTGLVCMPIARGELPAFRPWMANVHLVDVCSDAWHEPLAEADAENFAAFLEATEIHEPTINATYFIPDTPRIARTACRRAGSSAWDFLTTEVVLSERTLLDSLENPDPDARWLALEAYLLHGNGLLETAIHSLLAEDDEYARVSAVDMLLHFEDDVFPTLVQMMGNLYTCSPVGAKAAYLLPRQPG